jgi:starvation-inducible DNA-binding protein
MDKSVTSNAAAKSGSLSNAAVTDISEALRRLLADAFCLYLKTKNFHWNMTGSHFRDLRDNVEETLAPQKMLSELRDGNSLLTGYMLETHEICEK